MRFLKLLSICFFLLTFVPTSFAQYKLRKATKLELGGKCLSCINAIKSTPEGVKWSVTVKNGAIYFTISDYNYLDKLFPDAANAITVDIVTRDQYECGTFNKEALFSRIKRGTLMEPVYYSDFKKNIKKEEKTKIGSFKIGNFPPEFNGKDYEMNLLFIKDGTVCVNNSFYGLEESKWELLKMNLYMDTIWEVSAVKPTVKEIITDYEKGLKFIIPFEKNKWEYSPEDIKPLYDSLRLTDYQIFNIDIHAYSSIEGTTANNIKLQNKRAESIVKAMRSFQNEKITTNVKASENWVEFYNDMEGAGKVEIAKLSKKEVKNELNNNGLSKKLEPYLKKHRKAVITLELKKRVKHLETSNETVLQAYTKSLKDKDIKKALGLQQQLFSRVGEYGVSEEDFENNNFPKDTLFNSLKNNELVFHYRQEKDLKGALKGFEALYREAPNDLSLLYNICALKVIAWANGDTIIEKPRKLKVDILKIGKGDFDYKMYQRLLLNFHIARTPYSIQAGNIEERDRSIKFVKGKYRRIDCDDEDMIRVGKYLTNFGKEDWAEDVLYRKSKKIIASEDLIFYYLNLTITNPDNNNNERYRTIMYNAINQDKPRFCKMFTNYKDGGVTFQMLSNTYLKKLYCETCMEEK